MKKTLTITALCVGLSSLGFAQETTTTASMPTVEGTVSNPREVSLPPDAPVLSQADRTFVTNAALSGSFEVQSSQLAVEKGQDPAVKQFAQRMIQDHTAANQQLQQLATAKGVAIPSALDARHSEKLSKLQQKQGEEFDKAYVWSQVKAHREAVQLFQQAAGNAQDAEVKQFAADTLPKLQQHLDAAQQLPGADKKDKKDKKDKQNKMGQAGQQPAPADQPVPANHPANP